ncbi:DUF5000 domain-containing lipoprotein [uncultured Chitinophaga sp.]|uniref:DUF5000 domain-containing lipoprotein n=1 Tax=uncultured Chitinophaga sp. TaxID=339340 RepID=UPI0025CE4F00|nr:DUF5000 domain-containing lipoprotein [uncultured Chitinophaga sp.]
MKKIFSMLAAGSLLLLWNSCAKEDRIDHVDSSSHVPDQVSEVKVVATPGGAILTFKFPKDPQLAYVKATYEIQPGVIRETKTSVYSDTLVLEGFADTASHIVKVFSVGKNEKASAPLEVTVKPQRAPVFNAFDALTIEEAFGGVKIRVTNANEANLAVVLMSDTANEAYYTPLQTFYSKSPEGVFSFRGLPPVEKKFAVYLRDRWGNRSDTLLKTITPLYEEAVPKPFVGLKLPTDEVTPVEPPYTMDRMWDGIIDGWIFATRHSSSTPQWFAFDLKKKVVISRMKLHQRGENYTYTGGNVKQFELWGSNNPDQDGGWVNWNYLGTFNSYKPSGPGTVTAEDKQYAAVDGEDFDLSFIPPAYRYVRFKTTATWGGGPQITISELSFWGQIQ